MRSGDVSIMHSLQGLLVTSHEVSDDRLLQGWQATVVSLVLGEVV